MNEEHINNFKEFINDLINNDDEMMRFRILDGSISTDFQF